MGRFTEYPYRDYSIYNLDWVIATIHDMNTRLGEYIENNVITFGDPIEWNITKQYTRNTMVIDSDGTAYLSKQPVPVGIDIINTNYWQPIFNYDDNINQLRANIATNAGTRGIIPSPLSEGSLVWFNGVLYMTTDTLPAGAQIIPGENSEAVTVEFYINLLKTMITTEAENRIAGDEENADAIAQEAADRAAAVAQEATNRSNAINTVNSRIDSTNTAVSALNGHVMGMETRIDALEAHTTERHIVVVGDSYGTGVGTRTTTPFVTVAKNALNASNVQVYNCSKGGCAFGNSAPYNYLNALQETEESAITVNKNMIGEVWIIGGHNDLAHSVDEMYSKAVDLANYIHTYYPNAVIKVSCIGMTTNVNNIDAWYTLANRYKQLAFRINAQYVSGLEKVLSNSTFMDSDMIHPNQNGQNELGMAFANIVMNGTVEIYQEIGSDAVSVSNAGVTYTQALAGYWSRYGNRAVFYKNQVGFKPTMPAGVGYLPCNGVNTISLGKLNGTMYFGPKTRYEEILVNFILSSGGNYYEGVGYIYFECNNMYFRPLLCLGGNYANYDANATFYFPAGTWTFEI